MKIKTITYAKTWQEKQFEPERIEVTAELQEGENEITVIETLKEFVLTHSRTHNRRQKQQTKEQLRQSLTKQLRELSEDNDLNDDDDYDYYPNNQE